MSEAGVYLSDDQDARLRSTAPEPCRSCRHYRIKFSTLLGQIFKQCGRINDTVANVDILNSLMIRAAETGPCDLASSMNAPLAPTEALA